MNSTIIFDTGIVKNELNMSKWETLPQKRRRDKRITYRVPSFFREREKNQFKMLQNFEKNLSKKLSANAESA